MKDGDQQSVFFFNVLLVNSGGALIRPMLHNKGYQRKNSVSNMSTTLMVLSRFYCYLSAKVSDLFRSLKVSRETWISSYYCKLVMAFRLWFCAITAVYIRSFRWYQLSLVLLIQSILVSLPQPNKIDSFIQYWQRHK